MTKDNTDEVRMAMNDMETRCHYWVRETNVTVAEVIGILEVVKLNFYESLLDLEAGSED